MQCDPAKIRSLRLERAMTQDQLARQSNIERRTVQRAEAGEAVSLETLAYLAATLGVPSDRLLAGPETEGGDNIASEDAAAGVIVARKAVSARKLLDLIKGASLGSLDYEVEPTAANLPYLRKIVGTLERLMPLDPWERNGERALPTTLLGELECIAELGEQLRELDQNGLAVFAAEHIQFAVMPLYDLEYERRYVSDDQSPELVRIVRIVIGNAVTEKVKVAMERDWKVRVLDEDEIPF